MSRVDTGRLLSLATKVLTQKAVERAHGGWIPEKQRIQQQKEAQKRQKKADGGETEKKPDNQPYDLGQQVQRGADILGGAAQAQYERYGEPVVTGIRELMRPVYEGETQESYTNPEMVGHAMDVVGGLGAGSMLTGPSAAEANVLRSGMGPVAKEVAAQPQRSLSPLGFYSAAAERASSLQPKGDAAQMIAALKNTQGLKAEELMNAGLIDAQGNVHPEWANRGTVTREDLVSHLQGQMPQVEETVYANPKQKTEALQEEVNRRLAAGDPTWHDVAQERTKLLYKKPRYEKYTLPGGENYREITLRLNTGHLLPLKGNEWDQLHELANLNRARTPEEENLYRSLADRYSANATDEGEIPIFQSGHWDDPNVLAHIRMADRTGPNGEKILHVEELQSDWGQKGKKEGFAIGAEEKAAAQAKIKEIEKQVEEQGHDATYQQQKEWVDAHTILNKSGVPNAPYVTSTEGWTDLALKRVLKEAAEGGYDKVVWTPGAEQAARYDLSKQVDELIAKKNPDGTFGLSATLPGGGKHDIGASIPAEKLSDYVGKEMAEKISQQEFKTDVYSGDDLKVGGEGMKGYYDSIVPKRLQNLAKKHDKEARLGQYNWSSFNYPTQIQMPSLDITPAMRESILRGQSAYQRGGAVDRHELAKAAHAGRNGDTMLAHINPQEAEMLMRAGGSGTINPVTGLPQFDNPSQGDYGGGGYGFGQSGFDSGGGGSAWVGGGGGGRDSSPSIDRMGSSGGRDGGMGIGMGGMGGASPASDTGSFGRPEGAFEGETYGRSVSPLGIGGDIGSKYVEAAMSPNLGEGGAERMSPIQGISNGVLMSGYGPAGPLQSQQQMLQAMGIQGGPVQPQAQGITDPSIAARAAMQTQVGQDFTAADSQKLYNQIMANQVGQMWDNKPSAAFPAVPNAAELYGVGAPSMAQPQQKQATGPSLESVMGTQPMGNYLLSGLDVTSQTVPNTYSVNPQSVVQQVRAEWPTMTSGMSDTDIIGRMAAGLPEGMRYQEGTLTGDIGDPAFQDLLKQAGVGMATFKPASVTSSETQWGKPAAGVSPDVSSGVAPQSLYDVYGVSAPQQEEVPSGVSYQPPQPSSATVTPITSPISVPQTAPQTIRESFNQAFANARTQGQSTFSWTNPATGKTDLYTTALARKDGGRVYPLSDREQWKAHQRDHGDKGKLVHMNPDEFLDKAQKLEDTPSNKKDIKHWEKKIKKGKKIGPAALYTDGSQDGRHRVEAAKKLGIKKVPVLTWPERGTEPAKDYVKAASKIARASSKK